jgi:hypothetical protein
VKRIVEVENKANKIRGVIVRNNLVVYVFGLNYN